MSASNVSIETKVPSQIRVDAVTSGNAGAAGDHIGADATLLADRSTIDRFLTALDAGGQFTFQTFADTGKGRPDLARIFHGSPSDHIETLTTLGKQGAGIFVTVNE